MIELPPLFAGAANATDKERFRLVAATPVGGSGTVTAGTAEFEAAEGAPGPTKFVAVTVHV